MSEHCGLQIASLRSLGLSDETFALEVAQPQVDLIDEARRLVNEWRMEHPIQKQHRRAERLEASSVRCLAAIELQRVPLRPISFQPSLRCLGVDYSSDFGGQL